MVELNLLETLMVGIYVLLQALKKLSFYYKKKVMRRRKFMLISLMKNIISVKGNLDMNYWFITSLSKDFRTPAKNVTTIIVPIPHDFMRAGKTQASIIGHVDHIV